MNHILDKTDKGREEIATRKYHLAARLRTLLVLIDGKHTVAEILKQVAALGLNEQSVTELLEHGFVHSTGDKALMTVPANAAFVAHKPEIAAVQEEPSADRPLDPTIPAGILPPGENQFQALYNFYTSTIKNTIGLRGYGLQLKVERATSIDDFRELRNTYLEAVQKAKGTEMARSLGDRLDQLLYLGHPPAELGNDTLSKV